MKHNTCEMILLVKNLIMKCSMTIFVNFGYYIVVKNFLMSQLQGSLYRISFNKLCYLCNLRLIQDVLFAYAKAQKFVHAFGYMYVHQILLAFRLLSRSKVRSMLVRFYNLMVMNYHPKVYQFDFVHVVSQIMLLHDSLMVGTNLSPCGSFGLEAIRNLDNKPT